MPFPEPLEWAIEGSYDAGSLDWSNEPRKQDPGLAQRRDGFDPNQQVPAPWLNYIFNNFDQASTTFLHQIFKNWTGHILNEDAGILNSIPGGVFTETEIFGKGFTELYTKIAVASGAYVLAQKPVIFAAMFDGFAIGVSGYQWTRVSSGIEDVTDPDSYPLDMASLPNRIFVAGWEDNGRLKYTDGSNFTFLEVNTGLTEFLNTVTVLDPNGTYRILVGGFGAGANQIAYSEDGTTWTVCADTTLAQDSEHRIISFASSPNGETVIAVMANTDRILVSSDKGSTWTIALAGGELTQHVHVEKPCFGVTYNAVHGIFFVLGANGFCASADGIAWEKFVGSPATPGFPSLGDGRGIRAFGRHVASLGPAIAVLANPEMLGNFTRMGVYYSLDAGFNWYFSDFGRVLSVTSGDFSSAMPNTLKRVGGKLVAFGGGQIYTTPDLETTSSDLLFIPA